MKIRDRETRLDYAILDFVGDADAQSMRDIQDAIRKAASKKNKIVCNMSEVKHINSAGVNAFLLSAKSVIGSGGEVVFSAMLPNVERIFKLGRLDKYLKFFPSLKDAEEYFRTRGKIDLSEQENVLIIEKKNPFIKEHLKQILTKNIQVSPIETFSAKSTEEALRLLKGKRFSLVLLDSTLSMGEGKEFIEMMLGADGQADLPVLVVTTQDTIDNAQYFIRSGAHDIIQFPFNPVEVESRLRFMMTLAKHMKQA